MLCHKGTAITYIRMAAEFDGWGAGKSLLARYHGFSKQRHRTLHHTIENLRHANGTNICTQIDLFEKLCTQMAHNDPMNPPTEEQKIDWFLNTVTERTYESVHANCSDANIAGTLTFNKVIKLFTHKRFSRYPQFQLSELVGIAKSPPTNNSTTTFVKGDRRQKDNNRGKGKGKPKGSRQHQRSYSGPQTHDNRNREQGHKQKGKGKPNRNSQGNRSKKGPCNYCSKEGHEARECRKRIYDEKQKSKTPQTNNAQHLTIDETAIMFTQNVVFAIASDGENKFNMSDSDLEGDDTTNVPLVSLEYASNDALDSNREPTITHKDNTLQLDGGAIKSSEKQYGTFNTDDQTTCCQGDPPEHHNLQGSQPQGHYPSMMENEGHNPLIQHQTEESSADMSSGSHYPSHAKYDEGLAHHAPYLRGRDRRHASLIGCLPPDGIWNFVGSRDASTFRPNNKYGQRSTRG
jgi:hypothetical protein